MSNSIRMGSLEASCSPCSENLPKQLHQPQPILGSLLPNFVEPTGSVYPGLCLMPSNPIAIPNISRQSHDHTSNLSDLSLQSGSPLSSSQPSHNSASMYQAFLPFLPPLDSRVYPFQASQYLSAFSNSLHSNGAGVYNQTPSPSTMSSSLPASYSGYTSSTNSSEHDRVTHSSWYNANYQPNQYNQLLYQLSTLGHPNSSLSPSTPNSIIPNSINPDNNPSLKRPLVLSNHDNNKSTAKPSKKEVIKRKRKSTKRPSSAEKADIQISSVGPNGTVRTLLQTADAEDHFNKALKANGLKYLENTNNELSDSGTINNLVEAHFEKSLPNFKETHSPGSTGAFSQKQRCISISSEGGNSASSLVICGLNDEGKDCVDNSQIQLTSRSGSSTSCSPTSQLGDEDPNNGTEDAASWDISNRNSTTSIIKPRSFKPKQAWLSQYDKIIRC